MTGRKDPERAAPMVTDVTRSPSLMRDKIHECLFVLSSWSVYLLVLGVPWGVSWGWVAMAAVIWVVVVLSDPWARPRHLRE